MQSSRIPLSANAVMNRVSSSRSFWACDDTDSEIAGVVTGLGIGVDIDVGAGVGVGAAAVVDPGPVHPDITTISTSRAKQRTVASLCMVEPDLLKQLRFSLFICFFKEGVNIALFPIAAYLPPVRS